MTRSRPFLFGLLGGWLTAGALVAVTVLFPGGLSPGAHRDDEARILGLLRSHGDLLLDTINEEAGKRRQAQQVQRDVSARAYESELFSIGPDDPVLGNPKGRRTIVYFFDATCHFCRELDPTLRGMLRADPEIRLILRQIAFLGPRLPNGQMRPDAPSWRAAVLGDAVWHLAPEKYSAFIEAVMTRPIRTAEDLPLLAREQDFDPGRLEGLADAASRIERNGSLFRMAGGQGTPLLLVKGEGNMEILSGAVPEATITRAFGGSNPKH